MDVILQLLDISDAHIRIFSRPVDDSDSWSQRRGDGPAAV